ncbi:hypothetical protein CDL12_01579 [Handroanthus impetiginosus]|uniref:RNase H type-1 domain-containing protein n=1 Tax=Handroanthus impetiginosus TaxID=429701 RepID=A0A2G9I7E6_9LAMI|nr:hypothetical protein CDL12_01579 [Handroanthus impetiginosus]
MHCLLYCHIRRQVWALSNLTCSVVLRSVPNASLWIREAVSSLDFVSFARSFLANFHEATAAAITIPTDREIRSWEDPEMGWIKVNFNAAIFAKENKAGIGIIARDYRATVLLGLLRSLIGLCRDFNWSKVAIEGDCQSVI